tara:strand:- start:915 stop:1169 length:255 start_codon:yes stop_codon:yes gene_type:complete
MTRRKKEVKRFQKKGQYTTIDKSLFHKWMKEEGFSRKFLAMDLEMCQHTVDTYMDNPQKFQMKHIKQICNETGVDANFIMDLIY